MKDVLMELSKLLLYNGDGILRDLGNCFLRWEDGEETGEELARDLHAQAKKLLALAIQHGFSGNLWQAYLTYVLVTDENPFSLACERGQNTPGGSLDEITLRDLERFRRLFSFDFDAVEHALHIDCFSLLKNFRAANINKNALVQDLSEKLAAAKSPEKFFAHVTDFYRRHGVGVFGLHHAFRLDTNAQNGGVRLEPIENTGAFSLRDLVGYEIQKRELTANTEAFLAGRPANNVLLYGDSGTGKSTSVKALINDYYDSGLRMIELYKHQFKELPALIAKIKNRNYRFILFIDDLSFEEHEVEYKFLKSVIEGGVETKPENILIYATSNRRHIIREVWNDRADMEHSEDVHRSDTLEEKLSLASRFGVTINYSTPNRKQYHEIVRALAKKTLGDRSGAGANADADINMEKLLAGANAWELRHGGLSGRTAQQYIDYLAGREEV